jgi:hypothetical protein
MDPSPFTFPAGRSLKLSNENENRSGVNPDSDQQMLTGRFHYARRAQNPTAIGRSNPAPSSRTLADARLMVTLFSGLARRQGMAALPHSVALKGHASVVGTGDQRELSTPAFESADADYQDLPLRLR